MTKTPRPRPAWFQPRGCANVVLPVWGDPWPGLPFKRLVWACMN